MVDDQEYPQSILVVEDEKSMVGLIGAWLERAWPGQPVHITHAETLAEAIAVLHDRSLTPPLDALVVDCLLEDSIGVSTPTVLIQAMPKDQAVLPVVVLTGTVHGDMASLMLRHGAQEFLLKHAPTIACDLPAALLRAWERYRFWADRLGALRQPRAHE